MAFYNKVGNVLKQNLSASSALNGQSSMIMMNVIRCMSTEIFVRGLSFGTDDKSLKDAFSSFGDVIEARVITHKANGRSRGYGFVNFSSNEQANSAMSAMNGQDLNGMKINVTIAKEKPASGGNMKIEKTQMSDG